MSQMVQFSLPPRVGGRLQALGALVAAARRVRELSQTQLAQRAGTSRATINRLEQGSDSVAWGTVMTVCWLLDLPTDPDLLDPARRAVLLAQARDIQRVRPSPGLSDDF